MKDAPKESSITTKYAMDYSILKNISSNLQFTFDPIEQYVIKPHIETNAKDKANPKKEKRKI